MIARFASRFVVMMLMVGVVLGCTGCESTTGTAEKVSKDSEANRQGTTGPATSGGDASGASR